MTANTNIIRSLMSSTRQPPLLFKPPALVNPLVIIDFNDPTEFRGGFSETTGRVHYPSDAADVSWIPAGFTKVSYNPAGAPLNGRFDLATDSVYVFACRNSFQALTGYAWKNYRINADTDGSAVKDVLIIPWMGGALPHEFSVTGGVNIRMIGGHFKGSLPTAYTPAYPSGPLNTSVAVLRFANVKGSVYLEGVKVDANGMFGLDGIQPGPVTIVGPDHYPAYIPDYYTQNCIEVGLVSDVGTGLHSDGFQANGPVGNVYMDRIVCESEYQGLFLAQQGLVEKYDLHNVWCRYPANNNRIGAYNFWLLTSVASPYLGGNGPQTTAGADEATYDSSLNGTKMLLKSANTLTGNKAIPTTGLMTTITGIVAGDAFKIRTTNPNNAYVTITIGAGMTGNDFIAALNAVPGISATRNGSNFLVLATTDTYKLDVENTVNNPLDDLFSTNINGNKKIAPVYMSNVYSAVNGGTLTMTGDVTVPVGILVGAVTGVEAGDAFTLRTQNPANSPVAISITAEMTGDQLIAAMDAVTGITAVREAVTNYLLLTSTDGYDIELINTTGGFIQDFFETSFTSLPADWELFSFWPRPVDVWAGTKMSPNEQSVTYDTSKVPFYGRINKGTPPAQILNEASIGVGYVSPGYR